MKLLMVVFWASVLTACGSSQSFLVQGDKQTGDYQVKRAAAVYYPRAAKKQGIEGWVELKYDIDHKGNVHNVSVVAEQPKDVFTQAAIASVEKNQYYPAIKSGIPVASMDVIRVIKFKLTSEPTHKTCQDAVADSASNNNQCQRLR